MKPGRAPAHVNVSIVNGWEATPHSRPYMVSLQVNGHHICGGFLISDQFVLTAAHCWNRRSILTVVVGAHDLRESECLNRIGVKSYIPHPYYMRNPIRNDIMLLKLKKRVKLNNKVRLISLPRSRNIKAGTRCIVAGWGYLKTNGPVSNRLRVAVTTVKSQAQCKISWGSNYLASKMICAYGYGGSCFGDGGGPLVCGNTAVGITSFVLRGECNSAEHPNGYTKISPYLRWIRRQM
ncbi:granzyme B(G,H)-like [Pseudorasbora parva]|uniref:granzyme B(G,H)-like n=1 Tax=Pseudorasbora parva TaxID=51549 RepID=UPI00351EB820